MGMLLHYMSASLRLLKFVVSIWAWSPTVVFAIAIGISYTLRLGRRNIPWKALSAALVLLLVLIGGVYLFLPILYEETETAIASISAIMMTGRPVYHSPDAAQRYIQVYGPATYLAHVPFYLVFGTTLFSFKLLGVLASIVSFFGIYRICRRYAPAGTALVGLGAASTVLFRYLGVGFWGRIDPLILCVVVLCIWTLVEAPTWAAVVTNAVGFAIVPNLKLSGGAYLLPILGFMVMRKGWRTASITLLAAAFLFPLPFALPEVSLPNYVLELKAVGEHGLNLDFFLRNVQYTIILLLPILVTLRSGSSAPRPSRDQKIYLGILVFAMALSAVAGSKNGAGSYHLIPYIVPIVHLYFWMRSDDLSSSFAQPFARLAVPWVLAMLAFSAVHLKDLFGVLSFSPNGRPIIAEIRRDEASYKGRALEVGFGADFLDRRMEYVFVPPFDGEPYTFSATSVKDLQLGGVAMSPATLRYIETCGTQVWLIPKGDAPFTATNTYYDSYHPAFEEPFRRAFLAHYRKTGSGERFDIWSCSQ